MSHDVHYSSEKLDWETPRWLVDEARRLLGLNCFHLDPAADALNTKAIYYCGPGSEYSTDGLGEQWFGNVWLNPPYGRSIGRWVEKAAQEVECGNAVSVCALLPARPDTKWWHDHVSRASLVLLLKGRVKFEGAKSSAPFPSALVVWERQAVPTETRYVLYQPKGDDRRDR